MSSFETQKMQSEARLKTIIKQFTDQSQLSGISGGRTNFNVY